MAWRSSVSREIYISTDVETDGPIPGPNSMLSFGSVAILPGKIIYSEFSSNLETLEGATADPDTANWWLTQPKAWEACRKNLQNPKAAMIQYYNWLDKIKDKGYSPVFVGYPAGFDFLFIYWYLMKFVGASPFSFSAIDVKTYAMAMLNKPYRQCTKRNFPQKWFEPNMPHNHVALDDAREQGMMFMNMMEQNK